jgi:hypothetical protein
VEHVLKIQVTASRNVAAEGFMFSLILSSKKIDFLTFDEQDFKNWVDGLEILIDNKQHLFSLKYNIKDIITDH